MVCVCLFLELMGGWALYLLVTGLKHMVQVYRALLPTGTNLKGLHKKSASNIHSSSECQHSPPPHTHIQKRKTNNNNKQPYMPNSSAWQMTSLPPKCYHLSPSTCPWVFSMTNPSKCKHPLPIHMPNRPSSPLHQWFSKYFRPQTTLLK